MIRHIGLLMCRNEVDVIGFALEQHTRYFDDIVAQDGSTDGSREIIAACPQVCKLFKDEEVLRPGERWTDGHRSVALEWIIKEYGIEDVWVTLLHADEFWHDDPIAAATRAAAEGASYVLWGEFRFFLHVEDQPMWDSGHQVWPHWYCGPFFEARQFELARHQVYIRGQDHLTLPTGPPPRKRYSVIPRYRHYPYRSPAQMRRVFVDKCDSRYWQPDHAWLRDGDYFRINLPEPKNSPLAAWQNVGNFEGILPKAERFLPQWFRS